MHFRLQRPALPVCLVAREVVDESGHPLGAVAGAQSFQLGAPLLLRGETRVDEIVRDGGRRAGRLGPFFCRTGEPIALEKAARAVAMQQPLLHANPAKLVSTLATRHVVAPFVLFDGGRAPRTFLGIGCHPERIGDFVPIRACRARPQMFHFLLQFALPPLPIGTPTRPVPLRPTREAVRVALGAANHLREGLF
jgi:hypothetical protein